MIVFLNAFPGLKNVFADVVGYAAVSNKAHNIITTLLKNTLDSNSTTTNGDNIDPTNVTATDTIIKICNNSSLFINKLNPVNFNDIINNLKPLMKSSYIVGSGFTTEAETLKTQLYDLIVFKDNIGEAFWYIYTAIFTSSLVSYYLISMSCQDNPTAIQQNYNKYINRNEKSGAS
jgi:hypothetical protein